MRRALRTLPVAALATVVTAAPALTYDQSWYKSDFWGGEYPHGFTMTEAVSTPIRAEPDPDLTPSIDCALEKNATYHPWNADRAAAFGLEFVTYSRRVVLEIVTPIDAWALRHSDGAEVTLPFAAGDRWTYLTYLGEGMFLMQFAGETYEAEQELFEASLDATDEFVDDDEWMKLTCANGASGWLFLRDVAGDPAFGEPNISEYGSAKDRQ